MSRIARFSLLLALALSLLLALAPVAIAGAPEPPTPEPSDSGLVDPSKMPGPLKEVRFDQQLGRRLPLDAAFVDQHGRAVTLDALLGERPVVLAFVYYECPMLCTLILNGLAKSLSVIDLDIGSDFDVVAISFDPGETPEMALAAQARTLERFGNAEEAGAGDGWHFLTGDEAAIARVTEAAGFRFVYDPDTDEFAHTSGIVIVRPDGTLNQYYYGIEYPPRDVRLSLIAASEQRVGSLVDQLLLYCYRFDPQLGKYTVAAMRVLRLAGIVFVLGLSAFLWLMWRRERNQTHPSPVGTA